MQTGRTFNLRPGRDNQLAGVSAILNWEFADTTLTSITAFDQFDRIEANETFAADVAHEIKNPLTSLRSAVDTMKYAKDDAGREKLMAKVPI